MTRRARRLPICLLVVALGAAVTIVGGGQAVAAQAAVGLGTATSSAVLAGSTVTNTGPSIVSGDVGVSPGTAVVGFPPGIVNNGTIHAADAVAAQAQSDVTIAYNDAAGRSPTALVSADLAGQTLVSGVYRGPTLGLTGTVTLDAQGDPGAVFIFQAGSTLITATSSTVSLINGADACNVFWQIGSSATLGTNSVFVGTVLALTSVTANTGATVAGRLLARNAAVTLDSNTITKPACAEPPTTTTTSVPASTSTSVPASTSTSVPASTSTSTSTSIPASTSTTLPASTSTSTSIPVSTSTTVPVSTSTTLPASTSTSVPASTSTSVPASTTTTARATTTTAAQASTTTTARATTTTAARASTTASTRRITAALADSSAGAGSGGGEGATSSTGSNGATGTDGATRTAALTATSLARTGFQSTVGIAVGLLALVLGALMIVMSRRKAAGAHRR